MILIKDFALQIWIWIIFLRNKNKLPKDSNFINPKMEYELSSDAFIWEDEGLWELKLEMANAFKYVIHERMKLVIGDKNNNLGFIRSANFDKRIFNMAKKYFPSWIGFHNSRCSYNPEIAERMLRIKKVAEWRIKKILDEDDKIYTINLFHLNINCIK